MNLARFHAVYCRRHPRFSLRRLVLLVAFISGSALSAADKLAENFEQPPASARPLTWWHWMNGNISKTGIEEDLADMKRVGLAGLHLLDVNLSTPPGPVRYGTSAWREHVRHAIEIAAKHGLEFTLANCPGWSTSGGPWITPENAMKELCWSEITVEGGHGLIEQALPQPSSRQNFYRDIAVMAVPVDDVEGDDSSMRLPGFAAKTLAKNATIPLTPETSFTPRAIFPLDKIMDLTEQMTPGGVLRAQLPAGRWTILRFGYTITEKTNHPAQPEGTGLEVDKLDAAAVSAHFSASLDPILAEFPSYVGTTLRGVLIDSWEAGQQNWTAEFLPQFLSLRAYDLRPWLPVLTGRVIASVAETEAVLRDFRRTISDLIVENYFATMRREAHKRGLFLYTEPYAGICFNEARAGAEADIVMGEFWVNGDVSAIKPHASTVHTTGRSVLAAESFTAMPQQGQWKQIPRNLKNSGDSAFLHGLNRMVLHSYVHQPRSDLAPGFTLGRYGSHFGRLNTWWPLAGAWIDYLARCQYLLQQGHYVADILCLQNDDTTHLVKDRWPAIPLGYQSDRISSNILAQADIRGRRIHIPNAGTYRILVLPEIWTADLPTLDLLAKLVSQGIPVVGSPPVVPTGLRDLHENHEAWTARVASLWPDSRSSGAPSVLSPSPNLLHWLNQAKISPDFSFSSSDAKADVQYLHRSLPDTDIYFLVNRSPHSVGITAKFRNSAHRQPELWTPTDGRRLRIINHRDTAAGTEIDLSLNENESAFVIFRGSQAGNDTKDRKQGFVTAINLLPDGRSLAPAPSHEASAVKIDREWSIQFVRPTGTVFQQTTKELVRWNTSADPKIRHFSGIASYSSTFDISARTWNGIQNDIRYLITFERIHDLAEVFINGQKAATLWTPPFSADATPFLKEGENTIEIKVANRWINQLIGDEAHPRDAIFDTSGNRFLHGLLKAFPPWWNDPARIASRKRIAFSTWRAYEPSDELVDSGLEGSIFLRPFARQQ